MANHNNYITLLMSFYLLSSVPFLSLAEINLPLKAVNLGNWLVTEGWLEPSLFDEIPINKDLLVFPRTKLSAFNASIFLSFSFFIEFVEKVIGYVLFQDGTQVQLLSTKLNKYLCAENGGGTIVVANRTSASGWETFRVCFSAKHQ